MFKYKDFFKICWFPQIKEVYGFICFFFFLFLLSFSFFLISNRIYGTASHFRSFLFFLKTYSRLTVQTFVVPLSDYTILSGMRVELIAFQWRASSNGIPSSSSRRSVSSSSGVTIQRTVPCNSISNSRDGRMDTKVGQSGKP